MLRNPSTPCPRLQASSQVHQFFTSISSDWKKLLESFKIPVYSRIHLFCRPVLIDALCGLASGGQQDNTALAFSGLMAEGLAGV